MVNVGYPGSGMSTSSPAAISVLSARDDEDAGGVVVDPGQGREPLGERGPERGDARIGRVVGVVPVEGRHGRLEHVPCDGERGLADAEDDGIGGSPCRLRDLADLVDRDIHHVGWSGRHTQDRIARRADARERAAATLYWEA